jgi:hypothetical protein
MKEKERVGLAQFRATSQGAAQITALVETRVI